MLYDLPLRDFLKEFFPYVYAVEIFQDFSRNHHNSHSCVQNLQSTISYIIKYWTLKPRWHWTFSFSSAVPRRRRGKTEDDTYARLVCWSSFPSWQATVSYYSGNALATYSSRNHLRRYQASCRRIRRSGGLGTGCYC